MTPGELYELKRMNFIKETKSNFDSLLKSLDFSEPRHEEFKQDNGTVLNDEIIYLNTDKNIEIIFSNSYHPVDYGMEINIAKGTEKEMIYFKLKEEQDIEQSYIKATTKIVLEHLKS